MLAAVADHRETLSLEEIERFSGGSRATARRLAYDLVRKHWLQRLRRGQYLVNKPELGPEAVADTDPFRSGSRLVAPYYFGYATAAELLGLLPQAGRQYYVVTTSPDRPVVRHAAEFRFVHVVPARFFGLRPWVRRGEPIVISNLERTVLDCLYRPDLSGGMGGAVRVLSVASRTMEWPRLAAYLRRFGDRSLAWRFGHLTETRGLAPPRWLESLAPTREDPYAPLGPPGRYGRRGRRSARWHVIENVPAADLLAELEVR